MMLKIQLCQYRNKSHVTIYSERLCWWKTLICWQHQIITSHLKPVWTMCAGLFSWALYCLLHVIINPFSGARNWATNITVNQKPQTGASKGNMVYLLRDLSQIIRIHNAILWICLVWMCESRCISRRMSWGQLLSVNKLRPTNIAWTPYTTASRSAVTPCALYIWQDCSSVLYTHSFLSLSDERWGVKETQRGSRAAWGEDEEASRGTQKRNSGKGSLPVYLFYNNSEVLMTDLSRIYALPCLNSCSL